MLAPRGPPTGQREGVNVPGVTITSNATSSPTIGRYRVLARLGSGGMAEVFLGCAAGEHNTRAPYGHGLGVRVGLIHGEDAAIGDQEVCRLRHIAYLEKLRA